MKNLFILVLLFTFSCFANVCEVGNTVTLKIKVPNMYGQYTKVGTMMILKNLPNGPSGYLDVDILSVESTLQSDTCVGSIKRKSNTLVLGGNQPFAECDID